MQGLERCDAPFVASHLGFVLGLKEKRPTTKKKSSIKHCLTKGCSQDKEMQYVTLHTYDNHALSRLTSKVTHSFWRTNAYSRSPSKDLRPISDWICIRSTCVGFTPTINQRKNLVLSYQVPRMN